MKSTIEKIIELEKKSDLNTCDGDCDVGYPFITCGGCEATRLLNEIGEMLQ